MLEIKICLVDYEEIEGPYDLRNLIRNLLRKEPNHRITYTEISELSFLKEYFEAYDKE